MPTFPELFPVAEGGRVGLVGDTHANTGWFIRVIEDLATEGVRVVVQLGDFGWWPQYRFAQKISRAAGRIGVEVLFIDGNHEHHLNLRDSARRADPDYEQGRPVQLHPRLWYLPRGCAWEWSGVRFRALGGAYSIDRWGRTPGKDWFPEETPTIADAYRAIGAGPADVFLCHDYPALGYELEGIPLSEESDERSSRQVQELLAEVATAIEPELVVHGHWHRRYSIERDNIAIEGLDCDNKPRAAVVLDLETLQTRDWATPVFRHP